MCVLNEIGRRGADKPSPQISTALSQDFPDAGRNDESFVNYPYKEPPT
jgi:hypothetical protein